ncbi:cupin domain-containing protein [Paenibacillus pabuli]|uniref:cupin domain-containing protein n=1 Tax=Paenibacillus pabuli TaxID=1472 RepID=UPI001FFF519C|nr:cupin domain-containing protein [Paenibacillus pabuli]UPK41254.1 cupin domain-containing protein [Paenibacillus pabuli]
MFHELSRHDYHWHNHMPNRWENDANGVNLPFCNGNQNVSDPHPYEKLELMDYGHRPLVINIDQAAKHNQTFRTALWTGEHFQVTLMSIHVGEDIGLEIHPSTDQFIRIEQGQGLIQMGDRKDKLDFQVTAYNDYAIMIPAGKWHNVSNTGSVPLKIYVMYAPPQHPFGTVHETKSIAMSAEE